MIEPEQQPGNTPSGFNLSPGASMTGDAEACFEPTSPRQLQVFQVVSRVAPECGRMYLGAIRVLSDVQNPDRIAQAAHSLRELMIHIVPYLDVPVADTNLRRGQGSLKEKFVEVEKKLSIAVKVSGNCSDGKWSGEIHQTTNAVLCEVQRCAEWRQQNAQMRTAKTQRIMSKFDPLHNALPAQIQSMHADEWEVTQDTLVRVSHHSSVKTDEFSKWVLHLEQLLIDGLSPVTQEKLNEVDAIIKEGEQPS